MSEREMPSGPVAEAGADQDQAAAPVAAAESTGPEFEYFGEKFHYSAEFPRFAFAEMQEAIADDVDDQSVRGIGVALRCAVLCVAEKERPKFRQVSRANNAEVPDWLTVIYDRVAVGVGVPTQGRAGYFGGPSSTEQKSESQPDAGATSTVVAMPVRGDLALGARRSMPAVPPRRRSRSA